MGWWITLAILFLLAILPLGVSARYDSDGPLAQILLGHIRIRVYPMPDWMKKKKKPTEEKPQPKPAPAQKKPVEAPEQIPAPAEKKEPAKAPAPKKDGSVKEFLPLVKIGLDLLGDLRRKLRVNDLQLKIVLAGDDPCDLAVNYGRAWAAVGNLQPLLERVLVIKKRKLDVECDFTASQTLITAKIDITITLGRLLALLAVYGVRGLKAFLTMKKNKKAVQNNESETSQYA